MKRRYGLTPLQRIERRRTITEAGCWECDLAPNKPYALVKIDGKHQAVHRYVYEQLVGPIPKGLLACHHCDNQRCHNPEHIFLGTYADNIHDMHQKGRWRAPERPPERTALYAAIIERSDNSQVEIAEELGISQVTVSRVLRKAGLARGRGFSFPDQQKGSRHPRTKFTEDDIRAIRASGKTNAELAQEHGVSHATIWAIRTRANWKHVT